MGPWVSACGHMVLLLWVYGQTEHDDRDYCSTQGSLEAKGAEGDEEESSRVPFKDASSDLISSHLLNSHHPLLCHGPMT